MTPRACAPTLVGLAIVTLLSGGCASLKPPTLSVDGLKVGDMGVTGVAMDVRFRVRNPNPEPITVDRFDYELFLNGQRLGRGYDPKGFQLEGFGEEKVTSRFDVNLLSLPGAVRHVIRDDRGHARVKGNFYVRHGEALKKLGFDADADVDLQQ